MYPWVHSPRLFAKPLAANSVVIDANTAIALNKYLKGEPLQAGEQALIERLEKLGDAELRVADQVVGEVRNGAIRFQGISLTVDRAGPEYQAVLQELTNNNVGAKKGVADRTIVADTFFAHTEPGVVPTFATHDGDVYKKLLKMSGVDVAKLGKPVPIAYPNGFNVTIKGKTIRVIPLPNK